MLEISSNINIQGTNKSFDDVDPVMTGAPRPDEREVFWKDFLDTLREELNPKYGEHFIDDCLHKDLSEVKEKYFH